MSLGHWRWSTTSRLTIMRMCIECLWIFVYRCKALARISFIKGPFFQAKCNFTLNAIVRCIFSQANKIITNHTLIYDFAAHFLNVMSNRWRCFLHLRGFGLFTCAFWRCNASCWNWWRCFSHLHVLFLWCGATKGTQGRRISWCFMLLWLRGLGGPLLHR